MNATAGKPDELIQAEKEYASADKLAKELRKAELSYIPDRKGTGRGSLTPEYDVAVKSQKAAKQRVDQLTQLHNALTPRYETYSTPGGIPGSYQEHLLKVPERYSDIPDKETGEYPKLSGTPYHSVHWLGDPNVIAHWRADDRVGPNGEKVLHVHEVQSDLHQAGREQGYSPEEHDSLLRKAIQSQKKAVEEYDQAQDSFGSWPTDEENTHLNELETKAKEAAELADRIQNGSHVPNLPFKNNEWANLALKDIMDHAVKNGYDAVQFNNGELAKTYAAGGGGDIKGLKDWYERQIPSRMQKLFGLKNEPQTIAVKHEPAEFGDPDDAYRAGGIGNHTLPFFRLRHNGKLLGNLEKVKKHGMFLMSNQVRKL